MDTTLKQIKAGILAEFENKFIKKRGGEYVWLRGLMQEDIEEFFDNALNTAIKDALEAVRVDKGEHICEDGEPPEGEICGERFYTDTWNANTTQYDENMRKYLEE